MAASVASSDLTIIYHKLIDGYDWAVHVVVLELELKGFAMFFKCATSASPRFGVRSPVADL